ncbi:exodeoxyribonuclease V subunit beta [Noviherbaspirillum pedocola]|uniref:RecBCD enzyme subunit RecB n=1 Tax=Noviherbaspirillum pedocola TaxID=2801341 RepID=A0A934T1K6_9BURK|nr:exodeoxyribonuclease V subunit beta [Noviherbaspirillum pedocola]MBK4739131.1 exodeoxyribonuclease V subunit beta [Noviherbaspirillum pedocola]
MIPELQPIAFPLSGARLIEASAGTGKTWTIAALYLRLVLGHGGEDGYVRPLAPSEILVMTFTRAATRELSDRIRQRLLQAAACFRGESEPEDDFMADLLDAYPEGQAREAAAYRLALAAEAMDDAAVFTIDAWCQRMLREHAFDSGCLFDEELVSSEEEIFRHAVRDYWRHHVYALNADMLAEVRGCWQHLHALEEAIRPLVARAELFGEHRAETLGALALRERGRQRERVALLKAGWEMRIARMEAWIAKHRKALHGNRLRQATVDKCFEALREWIADDGMLHPGDGFAKGWSKLLPDFLCEVCNDAALVPIDDFDHVAPLYEALAALEPMRHLFMRHAAATIAARIDELKRRRRQFGFADMLTRLRLALEGANGAMLRRRIVAQFPVALIDEFQDTSPDQYRIFDALYRVADNDPGTALLLIGDPKQAIYGFRGADIHSYLAARRATEGRHYRLGTNFRSTAQLVGAVNHLFLQAEGPAHPAGAFRFRTGAGNPLPFEAVAARGRDEILHASGTPVPALTLWCHAGDMLGAEAARRHFAELCAENIVSLLGDAGTGFISDERGFVPLRAADIAVLVRNRTEAAAVRQALQRRGVPSVYLSDKDSVYQGEEAADMLRWLRAVSSPLDASYAHAAFATRSAGLSLAALAELAVDDAAWEARVEQLKALRTVWQRQGILAMLRRFIHELGLPAMLLAQPGGERRLTNMLHLAELLQQASAQLDGEQALIRWFAEQIANDADGSDERILRLESDAELVKVVTVHKSKGLEYPLVFLPFACAARKIDRKNRRFFDYADDDGRRHIDFSLSDEALEAMERARMEEDLRLLYVAVTRARHALWLGLASTGSKSAPDGTIHESAFGYLLSGGAKVAPAELEAKLRAMCCDCEHIAITLCHAAPGMTPLPPRNDAIELLPPLQYESEFERHWTIASYTSLTRDLGAAPAPSTSAEEKLLDEEDGVDAGRPRDEAWHRFPRGALPGQFLHGLLEWMAVEGFAIVDEPDFDARLGERCDRAGWEHRREDAALWLRTAASVVLPPIGRSLAELEKPWPEMEFWIPASAASIDALDRLCRRHLLDGMPRQGLQARSLTGMLRGFQDLVFELDGRYWVLDYKSNALGNDDTAYDAAALAGAMAAHRYDVQGLIYQLALHRLLKARLGEEYDPAEKLGGAIFYFLRGVGNRDTRGCHLLAADAQLLDAVDALLANDKENFA